MSRRESLNRQTLIINLLRKHPASFAEISDALQRESELQEYNFNISKRTFQRDCQDISSLYNIEIVYDRSKRGYCIKYDDQSEVSGRVLEAFDVFNALKISDKLSEHIHFEDRKAKGTENLYGLIHSIRNRLIVDFTYERYDEPGKFSRRVAPYAIKEFKNRWYLIGKDLKTGSIRTYGLDRIEDLEISRSKFNDSESFRHEDYYSHCFGIVTPKVIKPQEIILSFDNRTGKYIKSMPLHQSQKIVTDNGNELVISIYLCITPDLVAEILSYGGHVRVIKPLALKRSIIQSLKETIDLYRDMD